MTPYSLLIFNEEVTAETVPFIENQLKQGTKVFFFTYDPIDALLENQFLKDAKKNQFLFVYEVKFHEKLLGKHQFYDGEVPSAIIELLAEQTANSEEKFNEQQFQIEHSPPRENIIVSAGAGTGKTTVMLNRIIFLKVKNPGLQFAEIGLITFTNMAAYSMRDKLVEKLKMYFKYSRDMKYMNWLQELNSMSIGTIHSFAEKILKLNQKKLKFGVSPSLH